MRALLERSKTVRVGVAVLAAGCILGLVHAASAGGDLGLRRTMFIPDDPSAAFDLLLPMQAGEREPVLGPAPATKHRHPRRIWAAAHGRPLRIVLQPPRRLVGATPPSQPVRVAVRHTHVASAAVVLRLSPPVKTALVSIYDDKTLRNGDAVMLDDGIHIFRGDGFWPHRPRDFVRLQMVAGLDWHLRRTLEPFDRNPPTRWTAIMMPPA